MFDSLVISLKVTGDCACGRGGGGALVGSSLLYDLPVRAGAGVGVGVGCWQKTGGGVRQNNRMNGKTDDLKDVRSAKYSLNFAHVGTPLAEIRSRCFRVPTNIIQQFNDLIWERMNSAR